MRTITFHRNLNATNGNTWTYKPNGYAVQATTLVAHNVTIKQPSGKSFENCINGGNRSVFAWFKTKDITADISNEALFNSLNSEFKQIRFNPKNGQRFFAIDGKRVDQLKTVYCLSDGRCFGIEH
jgi:hypothetical protein